MKNILEKYKIPQLVVEIKSTYFPSEFISGKIIMIYLDDQSSIKKGVEHLRDIFEHNLAIKEVSVYYIEDKTYKSNFSKYKILAQRNNLQVKNSKDLENILDELLVNASLKNI